MLTQLEAQPGFSTGGAAISEEQALANLAHDHSRHESLNALVWITTQNLAAKGQSGEWLEDHVIDLVQDALAIVPDDDRREILMEARRDERGFLEGELGRSVAGACARLDTEGKELAYAQAMAGAGGEAFMKPGDPSAPKAPPAKLDLSDEFLCFDLDKLKATDLDDIDWLVPDLIPAGNMCSLAGPSGAGKTRWISLLLAALSSGRTDIMGMPKAIGPLACMYVANEERSSDLLRRIKATAMANGLVGGRKPVIRGKEHGRFKLAMDDAGTSVEDAARIDGLIEQIRRYDIDVIVFDPFVTLGGEDENSSAGVEVVLGGLARISEETGAAVVYVHHTPKDRSAAPDDLRGDMNAWRGSGAIYSGLDEGWSLFPYIPSEMHARADGKAKRKAMMQKQRDGELHKYVVFDHVKQREGMEVPSAYYVLESQAVNSNKDGTPIGVLRCVDQSEADYEILEALDSAVEVAALEIGMQYGEHLLKKLGAGVHEMSGQALGTVMESFKGWSKMARYRHDKGPLGGLVNVMDRQFVKVGDHIVRLGVDPNAKGKSTGFTVSIAAV